MKYFSKFIKYFSLVLVLAGCSKSLLEEDSPSIITADNLLVNKAGFDAAINGLYDEARRFQSGSTYGSANALISLSAVIGVDNAYANYRSPTEDPFNNWKADNNAAVDLYSQEWAWLYETINAANTIIDRSENPDIDWTDAQKNVILAEARCIRAWCYRHLTFLWGDVPLTLHESDGSNIITDWERTPVAEVRNVMEEDWLFAEQYLPETSTSNGRLIKGVAQHYLAELYLATNQPDKARTEALKVTQNTNYKLVTARYGVNATGGGSVFTDMFLPGNSNRSEGNTEALWIFQNELNVIGGEGNSIMRRYWVNRYYSLRVGGKNPIAVAEENGGRGIGRLSPTRFALDLYPAGDDRGSEYSWRFYWIINNPAGIPAGYHLGDTIFLTRNANEKLSNPDWPNTTKWDYVNPADVNGDRQYNDLIYLRAADTYLLLAEAEMKLNNPQGAADAINALRARAHAPLIDASAINLNFILDERSRELFSEEERRYTLRRTGTWFDRTKLYNKIAGPNVALRDTLLPIPQDVIDANITSPMRQNDGY